MSGKTRKSTLAALTLCALSLLPAAAARAAMMLTLTNGASTLTVTDNLAGDTNSNPGQITFVGAVGNFSTTITIATSNSPGSAGDATLQVSSIDVRNIGVGQQTLAITLGDTGFTLPAGNFLASAYAGTLTYAQIGDSTSFQSFADTSNAQNGQSGPTVTTTGVQSFVLASLVSPKSFNTPDASVPFVAAGAYSLTNLTLITLSAGAQSNVSGTTTLTVTGAGAGTPEPASLALLLPGALALLARRRHARIA